MTIIDTFNAFVVVSFQFPRREVVTQNEFISVYL